MSNKDHLYMKRALQLAAKALGMTSPNPMVGSVVVKDDEVIGEGYHHRSGLSHAEVNAIGSSKVSVKGATLYCTLEPCCHTNKKTPPCTDLIIEKRISRVVIASLDPNPEVSGNGVRKLREAGINVEVGVCSELADELNKVFIKSMVSRLPFVHLKAAITLDGRVATMSHDSKWISSEKARAKVHKMRMHYDGIMVGSETLVKDDPRLNVRQGNLIIKEPYKVVIGDISKLRPDHNIVKSNESILWISTTNSETDLIDNNKIFRFEKNTFEDALIWLKLQGVTSLLVEGGAKVLSTFIDTNLFDELSLFICPKLIGNGPNFYNNNLRQKMSEALNFDGSWEVLDSNEILYEVRKNVYRSC